MRSKEKRKEIRKVNQNGGEAEKIEKQKKRKRKKETT